MITISANNRRVRHVEPNPSRGQGTDLQPQNYPRRSQNHELSKYFSRRRQVPGPPPSQLFHKRLAPSSRTMESQGSLSPIYIVRPIFNTYFDHIINSTNVNSPINLPWLSLVFAVGTTSTNARGVGAKGLLC